MRKRLIMLTTAMMLTAGTFFSTGLATKLPATDVQAATQTVYIQRVGQKVQYVKKGKTWTLQVKKVKSIADKNLEWSVNDSGIVDFAQKSKKHNGTTVKIKATGKGYTTVYCKDLKTLSKTVFYIGVDVPKINPSYIQ